MQQKALEINNLVKEYKKGVRAVDDITFCIEQGEFYGFLGPNGAGKSTTIHCITGIARISSGNIKIFGTDVVKDYREARMRVGLAPQEYNVEFFGRVDYILESVAGYYGVRKRVREKRVAQLLEQFGLTEHKEKRFNELSGGLKRRVMLARAMVHDPDLLILDEPTAGIDVELRHELWEYLREINKNGKTIFLTSHYLEEIELLCKRIGIIHGGKIVASGTKEEFIKDGKKLEDVYLAITKGEPW